MGIVPSPCILHGLTEYTGGFALANAAAARQNPVYPVHQCLN
jgi:hypothetical protein